MEDLIEIEDDTEQIGVDEEESKKQRIEKENEQALGMRARAMERFGQAKKRLRRNHEGTDETKIK